MDFHVQRKYETIVEQASGRRQGACRSSSEQDGMSGKHVANLLRLYVVGTCSRTNRIQYVAMRLDLQMHAWAMAYVYLFL